MKIANRSVTTIVAISAALVLVFAAPGVAAEIVVYEENWESGGGGNGSSPTTYGYSVLGAATDVITITNSSPIPGSLAMDGTSKAEFAANGIYAIDIPSPAGTKGYRLTATLHGGAGDNDSGIGFSNTESIWNDSGVYILKKQVEVGEEGSGVFESRWRLDAGGLMSGGGGADTQTIISGLDDAEVVTGIIEVDLDNNFVTASIVHSGGTATATGFTFDAGDADAIDRLTIQNRKNGVSIDDISITVIPEPHTLLLTGLGSMGLLAFVRQRRQRK